MNVQTVHTAIYSMRVPIQSLRVISALRLRIALQYLGAVTNMAVVPTLPLIIVPATQRVKATEIVALITTPSVPAVILKNVLLHPLRLKIEDKIKNPFVWSHGMWNGSF